MRGQRVTESGDRAPDSPGTMFSFIQSGIEGEEVSVRVNTRLESTMSQCSAWWPYRKCSRCSYSKDEDIPGSSFEVWSGVFNVPGRIPSGVIGLTELVSP